MTQNGLIYLKSVDIKPKGTTNTICVYTYMLFYTVFITKEHFQIFGEMVQKVLIMRKYNLIFVKYVCMLTDC